MSPAKPRNYWVFIIILTSGMFVIGLAFADFFFNPDTNYMDGLETMVIFSHVTHVNV